MIDQIFDTCVLLLVFLADVFGTTYKAINVWVFVFIWPAFTFVLIILIILQQLKIRKLTDLLSVNQNTLQGRDQS